MAGLTVIYVDTLFLLNAIVDYLLLLCSARLAGERLSRLRFALGALLGGLYAVALFLPGFGFLGRPLCRLSAAVLMVLTAFGGCRRLLRQVVIFFLLSCAFGGGVLAIGLLGGRGLSLGGGVLYSSMDLKIVLLSAAGCYAVITLIFRGAGRHTAASRELLPARLSLRERQVELTGLVDTGNTLTDPATGRPVLVAEADSLEELLPPGLRPGPAELRDPAGVLERLEGEERRAYGVILLSMADGRYARAPGTSSMANGGRNIKSRIQSIARFKRYPQGMGLVSGCITFALALALVAGAPVQALMEGSFAEVALNTPQSTSGALATGQIYRATTVAGALAWQRGADFVFHPVNRLDKGTTGLMVVAKSGYIHDRLRYALHTERFCREYRAVCIGCPDPKSGTIDAPIGRDPNSVVGRCVRPDGARAVTHYEVLGRSNGLSLLRLRPETGRTHQLRVHMASIGCPLAGDWLYGEEDPDLIPRPALHAYALDLDHPVTGEHLSLTAPIPADMARLAPELLTETECASEEI